ncbi:hypothetical protein B9H02_06225 [Prosthecochloris sp. HL-130-GSB]|nr:hypothetical protein B9H02_06225 [Prosthecochloris sp. HL-130-GSB]
MTNPGEMRQEPQPAFFRTSLTGFGKQLCEALPVTFGCRELSSTSHTVSYYDSFEWNAWKKKRVIRKKGAKLSLLDLDSGHETASCPLRSTPTHIHPGRTSHDSVRELLSGLSALRAFIRLCRLEEQTTQLHITNDNEKTVAVVALTVMTLREKQREPFSITLLSVSPLRGYGNEARQLTGELLRAGLLSEETSFPDVYRELLSAAGLTPGAYSSKPSVRLDPGEPIHNSALKLLMATFRVMQANEPWLSKDLDTEFLHDYRVAIRRTRSVLAQLKGIFPSADTERFKNEFRQLAKRTNDLRDQDVYLLAAPSLKAMLPLPCNQGSIHFLTISGRPTKTSSGNCGAISVHAIMPNCSTPGKHFSQNRSNAPRMIRLTPHDLQLLWQSTPSGKHGKKYSATAATSVPRQQTKSCMDYVSTARS